MIALALALALAQDLDVALKPGARAATSVLDEIADPAQRHAFQELLKTTDPLRRRLPRLRLPPALSRFLALRPSP